jgi:aspartyl-tRNA(Asn)/glutamyl-tRNA(Gln) amidotransferase subunit A
VTSWGRDWPDDDIWSTHHALEARAIGDPEVFRPYPDIVTTPEPASEVLARPAPRKRLAGVEPAPGAKGFPGPDRAQLLELVGAPACGPGPRATTAGMTDTVSDLPWQGDACSLVDAFRRGERSPSEELAATLAVVGRSRLNAFSFLDPAAAAAAAAAADVSMPFGGVPVGVKELDAVEGWPYTEASIPLKDRVARHTSTKLRRLRDDGGAVLVGLTTSSEFGGVNLTRTVLNGATHNPWRHGRTPGGSSGGSAAAVAGGLLTLATGGDGGGSIRIPAGFCGLPGLKATYGRFPKGPTAPIGNLTAVPGIMARSVRDIARHLDVCSGHDARDPFSLPRETGWEAGLGSLVPSLRGLRAAVVIDFGGAYVAPACAEVVVAAAEALIADLGLRRVDIAVDLPNMGAAWSLTGLVDTYAELGDAWPACADDLTPEMRHGLRWADGRYDVRALIKAEERRRALNDAMAAMFDAVDLVFTASNPEVAFSADGPLPSVFGGREVGGWNNGRLTAPSNLHGNPAMQIPAGVVDGLPVGLQVLAPHFRERWLLDAALVVERKRPWPLVAPGSPV